MNKPIATTFSKLVSYIFHPVFMPLTGLLIILNSGKYSLNISFQIKMYFYLLFGIFTIIIPLGIFSVLFYLKHISNIELTERSERFFPYFFNTIALTGLHVILTRIEFLRILNVYSFSLVVASILLLLINLRLKISIHTLGIGGVTAVTIFLSALFRIDLFFLLTGVFLASGIIASSRLYLKAHSAIEVIIGYTTGFLSVIGCMVFLF